MMTPVRHRLHGLAMAGCVAGIILGSPISAQIVTDGSTGPAITLTGADILIPEAIGTRAGGNLFHSFSDFNINEGQAVTFTGEPAIENILARVTGEHTSELAGTLRSTINGASFYLINPNGIHFGPGAVLDVQGGFHAGTAEAIHLDDGTVFSSDIGAPVQFSAASPHAFGFLSDNPGTLTADGAVLTVLAGRALSLVSRDIAIGSTAGSLLGTLSGAIYLITTTGTEQIPLQTVDNEGTRTGNVSIGSGSLVDVSNVEGIPPVGVIRIRTGRLALNDGILLTQNRSGDDSTGGMDLNADAISIQKDGQILSVALADGAGSDVIIRTNQFTATERSGIFLTTRSAGDSGSLAMDARDVLLDNGIVSAGVLAGTGDAGDLFIASDNIVITNGASVTSFTNAAGNAGTVAIRAKTITIDGQSAFAIMDDGSIISADAGEDATGNAGRIVLRAEDSLKLLGRSQVSSAAILRGVGGSIEIETGELILDGKGELSVISTSAGGEASAGSIVILATDVNLVNGGVISSGTFGDGDAGNLEISADNITVDALGTDVITAIDTGIAEGGAGNGALMGISVTGTLRLQGGGTIRSTTDGSGDAGAIFIQGGEIEIIGDRTENTPTGIFTENSEDSTGQTGVISVSGRSLTLRRGGRISSSSSNDEPGTLIIVTTDAIRVSGEDADTQTGLFNDNLAGGGTGGVIFIATNDLRLDDRGQISTTTSGAGSAGGLLLEVGQLTIDGGEKGEVLDASRITGISSGALAASTGDGGIIEINADDIFITNNGIVTARSAGAGAGGSIEIETGNEFRAVNGRVVTSTIQSDGGNIILNAVRRLVLTNSRVTTSVSGGSGSGGNISIDPQFVILNQSAIQANAIGGNGGNIQIVAGTLLATPDSVIEASSSLGIDGQVLVDAPDNDVSAGLVVLEGGLLDAGRQLTQQCDAGTTRASFSGQSAGGLALQPAGHIQIPLPDSETGIAENAPSDVRPIQMASVRCN